MSEKKSLADWWAEKQRRESQVHQKLDDEDTVEEIYARLGKQPAVDVSVEIIRKEMAAVYRDMRSGRIDCNDGTRLAYVLDLVRRTHEGHSVRNRLGAIEKAMGLNQDDRPDWLGLSFGDDAGP